MVTGMARQSLLALVLVTLTLSGCRTIDPKAQATTDSLLASLTPTSGNFADSTTRKPWKAGQWVAYKQLDGEDPGVIKYSIVEETADGFWMEIYNTTYYATAYQKWLVSGYDHADPDSIRNLSIKRVITWSPDSGQQPMAAPPFIAPMSNSALKSLAIEFTDTPPESVTTIGGTFASRTKRTTLRILGRTFESDVFLNGNVPIWGMVKSAATDGSSSLELIAFGESGATAEVPPPMASPF